MRSFRLCLLGNSATGKTSIMNAYLGLPIDTEVTVFAHFRAVMAAYTKNQAEHRVKL